eukprot:m.88950 g.88950  ORF g.88950 m.88950 type:complete len:79 (-) comp11687_c0_seq2:668-904(-)
MPMWPGTKRQTSVPTRGLDGWGRDPPAHQHPPICANVTDPPLARVKPVSQGSLVSPSALLGPSQFGRGCSESNDRRLL